MAARAAALVELIHENGSRREENRMVRTEDGTSFAADLVFRDDSGFELWLGSLEDALSLEALRQHKINGILNVAREDCDMECACSRPSRSVGGRCRSHARGPSAMNGGDFTSSKASVEGSHSFDRDEIRGLASFDGDWYSTFSDRDITYLGIDALDQPGYEMDVHFRETTEFLARCREEGRKVLVHCVQGINRSSAALVAYLCDGLAMTLDDAIVLTATRRGLILSNDGFLRQLVKCYGHTSSPKAETVVAM